MLCIWVEHCKRVPHVLNCSTNGKCVVRNPCVTNKKPVKVSEVCEGGLPGPQAKVQEEETSLRFSYRMWSFEADEVLPISLLNNVS